MNSKTSATESRRPGRPPKAEAEKAKQCSVYFTPQSESLLDQIPGRTRSEKVNNAVIFFAQFSKEESIGERASA